MSIKHLFWTAFCFRYIMLLLDTGAGKTSQIFHRIAIYYGGSKYCALDVATECADARQTNYVYCLNNMIFEDIILE